MSLNISKIKELNEEDVSLKNNCNFCKESLLKVGEKSKYGSVMVFKIGNLPENSWSATLSPRTGGDPERDFSIQMAPLLHLTHFSQINLYPDLGKNYGLMFSKLNYAMANIMSNDKSPRAKNDPYILSVGTYGKCTTREEKKEHIHIKLFPFRGDIGQPFTVDSSYQKKEIYIDPKTKEDFIKMKPVKKTNLPEKRFNEVSEIIIKLLK